MSRNGKMQLRNHHSLVKNGALIIRNPQCLFAGIADFFYAVLVLLCSYELLYFELGLYQNSSSATSSAAMFRSSGSGSNVVR